MGRIALISEGLCAFEYDSKFLERGFSISPYVLPLQKKVFVAERDPFDGNFGVFDDSLPDGWGSLLLDRFLKEQGKELSKLTILDKLSLIGSNGRGALEYRPDNSFIADSHFKDFDKISSECKKKSSKRGKSTRTCLKSFTRTAVRRAVRVRKCLRKLTDENGS